MPLPTLPGSLGTNPEDWVVIEWCKGSAWQHGSVLGWSEPESLGLAKSDAKASLATVGFGTRHGGGGILMSSSEVD